MKMIKSLQFGQKLKPYVYIHVKDYPFSEESQKMLRFNNRHVPWIILETYPFIDFISHTVKNLSRKIWFQQSWQCRDWNYVWKQCFKLSLDVLRVQSSYNYYIYNYNRYMIPFLQTVQKCQNRTVRKTSIQLFSKTFFSSRIIMNFYLVKRRKNGSFMWKFIF